MWLRPHQFAHSPGDPRPKFKIEHVPGFVGRICALTGLQFWLLGILVDDLLRCPPDLDVFDPSGHLQHPLS